MPTTLFLILASLTFQAKDVTFRMVEVKGGVFRMGATIEQRAEGVSSDKPVHAVTVDGFYIGETEVTRQLWKRVMGEDAGDWMGDRLPIEWVSWNDCQEFIRRLDSITGAHFRLPTEAEWEYAARGGQTAKEQFTFSGADDYEDVAWLFGNSGQKTHEVATKKPNGLGLYDMSGNVWEWCSDWYAPYDDGICFAPKGPTVGETKVVRGNSWDNSYLNARLSARQGRDPSYSFYDCGLRLAMDGEKVAPSSKQTAKAKGAKITWKNDTTIWVKVKGQKVVLHPRSLQHDSVAELCWLSETTVSEKLWKTIMGKKAKADAWKSVSACQQRFVYLLDSISGLSFEPEIREVKPSSFVSNRKKINRKKKSSAWTDLFNVTAKQVQQPWAALAGKDIKQIDTALPPDAVLQMLSQAPWEGLWLKLHDVE